MKPLIAITTESQREPQDVRTGGKILLNWNYTQAVAEAGGVPIIVPPLADMAELASIVDGWLLTGGADLDSALWGEPLHPKAEIQDGTRYDAERRLYDTLDPQTPIFGICYGCQALNVLRGGTLEQHLPDAVDHEEHSGGTVQRYTVASESRLAEATGRIALEGKSYHHQAVGRLADGLVVTARAEDGTIEAIEANDRPWVVGVQWHPERTLDDEAMRSLFARFVGAARDYRAQRLESAAR